MLYTHTLSIYDRILPERFRKKNQFTTSAISFRKTNNTNDTRQFKNVSKSKYCSKNIIFLQVSDNIKSILS